MTNLFDTIATIGSIGSVVGGIFSALQFFGIKNPSRKAGRLYGEYFNWVLSEPRYLLTGVPRGRK